jgi:hypothetical protein
MLHYKVFTSAAFGDVMDEMEKAVNAWLEETQPLVHTMAQSGSGTGSVVISFLYELDAESSQRARVATAEAPVEVGVRGDISNAESVMITLLPHLELPY